MEKGNGPQNEVPQRSGRGKGSIRWIILAAAILILGVGVYVYSIVNRPQSLFEETVRTADDPAATDGDSPRGQLFSGIVNIALFGIDAFEDGGTTSGTMPHTDAAMIVAVDFDTKEISLISIARDILTNIPGHSGFYKFNGVFNVGGGMEDPHGGLELACRTAEMWLGGLSVPYYCGVDFQAVIDLVDAIGGIDYDVDQAFQSMNGSHTYDKGMHHLDGDAVLGYLRIRRAADGLDSSRTARQRRMMVALFQKLKKEGQLSMIPELMKIMRDSIYTNINVAQVAALVNFAQDLDSDSIRTYSFQGTISNRYDWAFCFIFQQDRIEILKKVYDIDAEPMGVDSSAYEQFLHEAGFQALQHIGFARRLLDSIVSMEQMSEEHKKLYDACRKACEDLESAFEQVSEWTKRHYDETIQLTAQEREIKDEYYQNLSVLEKQLRISGDALNEALGSSVSLGWFNDIGDWYMKGSVINEVYVDFS